jgi:hypothetical protein
MKLPILRVRELKNGKWIERKLKKGEKPIGFNLKIKS